MKLFETWLSHLPEATLTGRPTPVGNIHNADCAVVEEFSSDSRFKPNQHIADYLDSLLKTFDTEQADQRLKDLPLFVSGSIATILLQRKQKEDEVTVDEKQKPRLLTYRGHRLAHIFEGKSADNGGENLGTYGELKQFRDYRDPIRDKSTDLVEERQYVNPIFITSGYNVGNIQRQAELLGIWGGIVPEKLPRSFDLRSGQLWTKHWVLWALSSKLRLQRLREKGH